MRTIYSRILVVNLLLMASATETGYAIFAAPISRLMSCEDCQALRGLVLSGSKVVYLLFWKFPLYGVVLFLSSMWYGDISKKFRPPSAASSDHFKIGQLYAIAESVGVLYRILLVSLLWLEGKALELLLPYPLGHVIFVACNCWMSSFFAYDYIGSHTKNLLQRIHYFEERGIFFLGFGTPLTIVSFLLPPIIGDAIYALVYPLLIALVMTTKPPQETRLCPVLRVQKIIIETLMKRSQLLQKL